MIPLSPRSGGLTSKLPAEQYAEQYCGYPMIGCGAEVTSWSVDPNDIALRIGSCFRVENLGIEGSGLRIQGLGFRAWGSGVKVWGAGFRV